MKDGIRFVDSDMHVMEPPDLFDRYLDPRFKHRVSVPVGADGRPNRGPSGLIIIDGEPTSDMDLQQYRKRVRPQKSQSTQLLSGSRIFDTGRLDFAIERDYNAEAQVMGMAMEGVDIAVLYPTAGLALMGRNGMDPQLSLALCQAYNNWIHDFCQYSPERFPNAPTCVWPLAELGLVELMHGEHHITRELTALPTPGHTPGHVSILITSQGERALVLGDVAHSPVQVREPDWVSRADMDPELTRQTRRALVERLEREAILVAAGHFQAPGFGRVVRLDGRRYWRGLGEGAGA